MERMERMKIMERKMSWVGGGRRGGRGSEKEEEE